MGNVNLLEIFALILTISVSSAFNLRKIENDTLEQQQQKGAELYSRIYAGELAGHGEFRYQVGLRKTREYRPQWLCGGSLITANYVLTAAQCVDSHGSITVNLDTLNIFTPVVQYVIGRHDIKIHSGYIRDFNRHNIAVIKIPGVVIGDRFRTVLLPPNNGNHPSYVDAKTILTGYGYDGITWDKSHVPGQLWHSGFGVVPNAECAETYHHIDDTKLCMGAYLSSACIGDAGNPMVLGRRYTHQYQIGIYTTLSAVHSAELSEVRCYRGELGVLVRIDQYLPWIHAVTDLNGQP